MGSGDRKSSEAGAHERYLRLSQDEWIESAQAMLRWLDGRELSRRQEVLCGDLYIALRDMALNNSGHLSVLSGVIQKLGEGRWEQEVNLSFFGRGEKELGEGQRPHKSLLRGWSRDVAEGKVDNPLKYYKISLENAARDAWRKESLRHKAVDRDPERSELPARVLRRQSAYVGDADGEVVARWDLKGAERTDLSGPDVNPTNLPRRVAATLEKSCDLYALLNLLGENGQGPLHEAKRRSSAKRRARGWEGLAVLLRWDIALGERRFRWDREASRQAGDSLCRAWQARYYDHEGPLAYGGAEEIPARVEKTRRARFDKNTSRFREIWAVAVAHGEQVIEDHGGELLEGERVPFGLDAPTHTTLISQRT